MLRNALQRISTTALSTGAAQQAGRAALGAASCRLRDWKGLFTSAPAAEEAEAQPAAKVEEDAPRKPLVVDLDADFDRDDPEFAQLEEKLEAERPKEPLVAVDLDADFDRDDPEFAKMTERLEVESPKEPLLPVDLDADFDRDDPEFARMAEKLEAMRPKETLVNVDLEFELDHDDPDMVNKKDLWKEAKPAVVPKVDLDDEMDLIHEKEQKA